MLDSIVFVLVVLFLSGTWWRWTRLVPKVRSWDSFARTDGMAGSDRRSLLQHGAATRGKRAYLEAPPRPFPGVRAAISTVLLLLAVWIVLPAADAALPRELAYGILGLLVGYWLPKGS